MVSKVEGAKALINADLTFYPEYNLIYVYRHKDNHPRKGQDGRV